MVQYVLQSIKLKNHKVGSKELSKSGKSWVKAQFDTQYQVVDEQTGLPPKKLRLRKKDKNLIIESDSELLVTIRGFYADTHADPPAQYRVISDCDVGLPVNNNESSSRAENSEFHNLIGGIGKNASQPNSGGYVWTSESGICAYEPISDATEHAPNRAASVDFSQAVVDAHPLPVEASEALSRAQMVGIGLGGALLLGAAAGGGGGGGGGAPAAGSGGGGGGAPAAGSPALAATRSMPTVRLARSSDSGVVGDGITSDTTPTIEGTGTPGDRISITMPGSGEVLTTIVGSNGSWSVTPTIAIPDGTQGSIMVTAIDAAGNVVSTSIAISIITDLVVQGTVSGGPMYAGIGLEARDSQGNVLATSTIQSDGTYSMSVSRSGGYRGAIMVTAVDNNGSLPNYIDEVTGVSKSLGVNLRGLGAAENDNTSGFSVLGNGNAQLTVNISILSELAVRNLLGADVWPTNTVITTTAIIQANKNVAQAFGISATEDITTILPTTTNSGEFNGADGLSVGERVGLVLAKLSGLDALNGGNVGTSLDQLTGTINSNGTLTATGARLVDQGRAQALLALKANDTTFNAGGSDTDNDTRLNRQLLGDAVVTGQTLNANGTLSVTGQALPGSTVIVTLPDGTRQTTIANADGIFTLISVNPQPDLTNAIEIESQDGLAQPVVYDPPAAPVIEANNGRLVNGSGTPGSTVTVKLLDGTIVGVAVVDPLGNWSILPTDANVIAALRVTVPTAPKLIATAIDEDGNVSGPGQKIVDINGIASQIPDASDGYVNSSEKNDGSAINIYLPVNAAAGDIVTTVVTRSDGSTFSLVTTLTSVDVASGIISQLMTAADLSVEGVCRASTALNHGGTISSPAVQRFVLDTVSPSAPDIQLSNGSVINGTAEPGSVVTIMDGSVVIGTVGPVGADGNWTLVPPAPLTNASVLTASATDAAGNASTSANGIVNTQALIITGIVDNVGPGLGLLFDGAYTNDSSPQLSGTLGTALATGQALQIYRKLDSGGFVLLGTPTVNGSSWNLQDSGLADGAYTYEARIIDGSTTVQSSAEFNLNVQSVAPAAPSTSIPEASDYLISAAEKASSSGVPVITLVPVLARVGDIITTVVTLPGGATYTMHDVLTITDIQVGQISQLLPEIKLGTDGAYSVNTTYKSALTGLVSDPATNTFHLAASPPALSINEIAGDDIINAIEKSGAVTVSGSTSAEPGQTVTVTLNSQNYTAVVQANGTFSANIPAIALSSLVDNIYSITANVSNAAGTPAAQTSRSALFDTVAPSTPTVTLPESSNAVNLIEKTSSGGTNLVITLPNDAKVGDVVTTVVTKPDGETFTLAHIILSSELPFAQGGTATSGAPYTITQIIGTAQLNVDGVWGTSTTITDFAGNISSADTDSFTLDTIPPTTTATVSIVTDDVGSITGTLANDGFTDDASLALSGILSATLSSGEVVKIYDGNTYLGDATVSGTTWTFVDGRTLANEQTVSYTARVANAVGNQSAAGVAYTTTVDTATPSIPIITAVTDNVVGGVYSDILNPGATTNDTTPTLSGTAERNSVVSIYDGVTLVGTALTDSSGSWTFTPTSGLAEGAHSFTVKATDLAGNVSSASTSFPLTVDSSTPTGDGALDGASDTGIVGDNKTKDNTPILSGEAEAGATVQVIVNGKTYTTTATNPTSGPGSWSIDLTTAIPLGASVPTTLPDGAYTPVITITDAAGNSANINGTSFTVDSFITTPLINLTNGRGSITGQGEVGATITLQDSSGVVGSTVVGPTGSWSISLANSIADGEVITALAEDAAGNVSGVSSTTVNINNPIVSPTNGDVITGTGKPGDYIKVSFVLSGQTITLGPVLVASDGTWSVTPAAGQVPTNQTAITAVDIGTSPTSTTIFGEGSAVVDRSPPSAPNADVATASDTGSSSSDNITSDTTPTIVGDGATPGDTINLFAPNGMTLLGSSVVASDGTWSITLATIDALSDGTHNLIVTATDPVGNVSSPTTVPVTVDTTAPSLPTVTFSEAAWGGINAAEASNGTPTGTPIDLTFSTVGCAVGDIVITVITKPDGSPLTVTTTLTSANIQSGAATQTIPSSELTVNGTWQTVTTITDLAGNVGIPRTSSFLLDTVAPAAPLADVAASSDSGNSNTDNLTNNTTPTITGGSATPGDTITLKDSSGNLLGTATVDSQGDWSITPSSPISTGTLKVTATDPTGNISPETSVSVVIDTMLPTAPAITSLTDNVSGGIYNAGVNDAGATNDTTPTLTGTAEAYSTVNIYDGGNLIGTAITDGTGHWSYTTNALSEGSHDFTVAATDAAGNTGSASSSWSITVDTVASTTLTGDVASSSDTSGALAGVTVGNSTDNITSDTTPSFTGAGEAGNVITLTLANVSYKTIVKNDGTWTIETDSANANYVIGTSPINDGKTYATYNSGNALDLALPNNGANVDNAKTFSVSVTETDSAGNAASVTVPITIDTIVTDPTINITNGISPITGTGEAGAKVVLYQSVALATNDLNSATIGDTLAITGPSNGLYTFTYTLSTALATNHVLTTSKPRDMIITSEPALGQAGVVTGTITEAAYDAMVASGNSIILYDSVQTGNVVTVDSSGNWSVTFANPLASGTVLTANSVDLAGNIDPPGVAIVETDSTIPLIKPTDGSPIMGTGKPGNYITVTYKLADGTDVTLSPVLVDANGAWAVTPGANQVPPDGTIVTATDIGTNSSSPVQGASSNATVDAVAPNAPNADVASSSDTGSSNSDNITSDTTPTIAGGGANPGDTITLKNGTTILGTAVVAADGSWSITPNALAPATYDLSVTATDLAGNVSPATTVRVVIDTAAPAAPPAPNLIDASDSGTSATDNITSTKTPTFSGTGTVGETITVYDGSTLLGTAVVDGSGVWNFVSPVLADGVHSIKTTATDLAGNVSASYSPVLSVTVDTSAPTGSGVLSSTSDTLNSTVQDNRTNDSTPILWGTAEAGSTVSVVVNGVTYAATLSGTAWTLQIPTALVDGAYTPVITVTDPAGNSTTVNGTAFIVDTTAPVLPTISTVADDVTGGVVGNLTNGGVTNDVKPTLTGAAEAGSSVAIYDGTSATPIATVTADPNGMWTYTPSINLATGSHSFTVKATDVAGNTTVASSAFVITIDNSATTAPGALTVAENANGGVNAAEVITDGGVPVTVPLTSTGAVVGDIITLTVDDPTTNTPIKIIYTITSADISSNSASVLIPTAKIPVDGTYNFSATITDLAGNVSNASTGSFTVDKTAPNAGSGALSSTSDTLNSTAQDNRTSDNTPILSGNAEAGATVSVVINGKTYTINPTLTTQPTGITYNSATGAWSIDLQTAKDVNNTLMSALVDGSYTPVITVTDPAGNSATANGTVFIVDATAPVLPTIATVNDNVTGGVVGNLANGAVTNDTTPTLTGTAEAGSVVAIYDGASATPIATVTADVNGVWTYTPSSAIASGSHSFTVKATDIAGNTTVASDAFVIAVDTAIAAPTFALAVDSSGGTGTTSDGITNNGLINVSGIESGATWQYSLDNGSTWQTGSGASFLLPSGAYSSGHIQVKQVDTAGNVSSVTSSASNMTVDTSVSAPTFILSSDTGGSGSDRITNNGVINVSGIEVGAVWQYSVDGGSTWNTGSDSSFTLSGGNYPTGAVQVRQTDVAGNVSSISTNSAGAITVDTTGPTVVSFGPTDGGFGSPSGNLTITFSEVIQIGTGNIRLYNDTNNTYVDIPVNDPGVTISGNIVTINPNSANELLLGKSYHVQIDSTAFKDIAGNAFAGIGDATTWNFDVPDPSITLNPIATDNLVNAVEKAAIINLGGTLSSTAGVAVIGLFVAGDIHVTLTPVGGGTTVTVTVSSYNQTTGAWSGSVPANTLVDGKTYTVSVQATHGSYSASADGQVKVDATVATPTFALAADTAGGVGTTSDGITKNNILNVSGIEASATWQYTLDGGTTWLTGEGSSFSLPAGTYSTGLIKVKQIDAAGNASGVTSSNFVIVVDQAITTPTGGLKHDAANDTGSTTDNLTNKTTPVITGTAEANASISVFIDGRTYTATADASGNWGVTVATALTSGTYTPVIAATDKAGNTTTVNGTPFTVDVITPNAVTSGLAVISDSGTQGDNRTNDTTPTLTGNTEPGATVKVTVGGILYTTTADANGVWSITTNVLINGTTYTPSIVLVDAAGNTSAAINGAPFAIDTAAPTGTAALASISDSGTIADNKTNDSTPVLGGTAESGATVAVTVGTNIYQVVASSDGKWTLDLGAAIPVAVTVAGGVVPTAPVTLANGSYTPTIKVTDTAGNTSASINGTAFTVDITPPVVSLTSATLTSGNNAVVKSNEVGTVYLIRDSVTVNSLSDITGAADSLWNSVSVSANTNTNLSTTGLADGTYKAYAVDAAGNLSLVSTSVLTMDSKLPTVTNIAITSATGILNNRLNVGDVVSVTMTTSEVIATASGGLVLLNIGGTQATSVGNPVGGTYVWATLDTGSLGTNKLVFKYTITASQTDANGISIYPSTGGWLNGSFYDAAGNALNTSTAYLAVPDNAMYMVDTTVATPVLALAADTGTSTTDRVTNINTINVTGIESGATWEYSTDNGVTWSAGAGASFNVSAASYTANYVQVRQTDLAGNAAVGKYAYAFTVDNSGPAVNGIAITSATGVLNSTLNAGDVVTLTVNMSEATTVVTTGGVPRLALNIGGQIVYADYTSGTGTTALVFKYTIEAGLTDIDGISIDANKLSANGGLLYDASGNAAVLTHAAVTDNGAYKVDTTKPTISIARNGSGLLGTTEIISFTLSESSADFVVGDITVTNGSLSSFAAIAGSSNKIFTAVFTPTANSAGTATIGISATKFTDAAGNANLDTNLTTSSDYEPNNQVSIDYDTKNVITTVSFNSMTKDTSTVTATADWTTSDGSPGRLLSGTISAALTTGQTLKIYRDNILIGDAIVASGGKSWEITDPNGYSGNWTYTAKVVGPTGLSGTLASRAITLDNVADAAPVITAITDSAGKIVASGAMTVGSIASVSGTGAAGSTVYLYDNADNNLVGTAVVAAGGTWSITGLATNTAVSNTVNGNNSNTFAAIQVDVVGNQSVLSNLWRVTSGASNLITNGDFSTNLSSWTLGTIGTGVAPVNNFGGASLGAMIFNSSDQPAGGRAAQTITTVNGSSYSLNISAKSNSAGGNHTVLIEALDGTTVLNSITSIISSATPTQLMFDFTAASTATTIRITNTAVVTTAGNDLWIDDVIVRLTGSSDPNTLITATNVFASSANADQLDYSSGMISSLAGNDTITAVSATLQTILGNGRINGGAGVDTLQLASGTTLDLTIITNNQTVKSVQEIEIIEMQGGDSRIVLSANDVLSLGGANASTMSGYTFASTSGGMGSASSANKVQMVVLGQSGDVLDLKELSTDGMTTNATLGNAALAGVWIYMGTAVVATVTYKVYNHSTTGAQVLVDPDVAVNTKFISFNSMTKDTGIGADTSNSNWTTADISAGRLVSGTLDRPLASGEVVKIYRTVSGVESEVGVAVMNTAGTVWEVTDLNSYTGNWTYTAKVLAAGATVSVRTQAVNVDQSALTSMTAAGSAVTYSTGTLLTSAANDVITASATTLQTTLTTGGGCIIGGSGLDTLKLTASTTLDLSASAMTLYQTVKSIQEVEIFTLQGNSTLTLSANDVLSLGATDAFTANGKVQFMVNATATDTVNLKGLLGDGVTTNALLGNTGLTGVWVKADRLTYNNLTYDIYNHSTTGAQVWVQATAKIAPTISITRSGTTSTIVGAETITFTLSNASTDFVQSDVTVSGGVLSNWLKVGLDAAGRQIYTATFTPTANTVGAANISVANAKFSVGGLFNADGADIDNKISAPADTALPVVAITQKSLTPTTSLLTFTLNRSDISDFIQSDVTLNTGSLSNWTHVGINSAGKDVYTATYTYVSTGNKLVTIGSGAFTDRLGRTNADGADANNKLDFTEAVSSTGAVIYNGVDTAYSPLRLNPTTIISAGQMVTNLKMSLDYSATAGDGISFAFGSGGYRGYAEYGLVNGVGATLDALSSNFGGNWVRIYDNNYASGETVPRLNYAVVGNHHADFDVSVSGFASLSIDGVVVTTRQLLNWTTASQAGWYFQVQGRTGSDGGYFAVSNLTMSYGKVSTGSPLMLDLNGDGVQTVSSEHGVDFDLQATGTTQRVGWVDSYDGILALDLNGDGLINSGLELFGDQTSLADSSKAIDGWQALAQHDINLDGVINQQDTVFDNLKIWVDANTNGQTDVAELKTLNDLGIVSIDLNVDARDVAQNGNILRGDSKFTTADGVQHQIVDAWLSVAQTIALEDQLKNATPVLSA